MCTLLKCHALTISKAAKAYLLDVTTSVYSYGIKVRYWFVYIFGLVLILTRAICIAK